MGAKRKPHPLLSVHPAADLFPMLEGEEYEAFKADIKKNGVRQALVVDEQGRLLDGRNRKRAMEELGVSHEWVRELFRGTEDEALDYITSANLHRRHLTTAQRAAVAVDLVPMYAAEAKEREHAGKTLASNDARGKSAAKAAKAMNVSPRSVERAVKVKREDPAAFERVKRGEVAVSAALPKEPAQPKAPPVPANLDDEKARDEYQSALASKMVSIGYHALAHELHPDKPGGSAVAFQQLAEARDMLAVVGSEDRANIRAEVAALYKTPRPCPFCASADFTIARSNRRPAQSMVTCRACQACGPRKPTDKKAIAAWNEAHR